MNYQILNQTSIFLFFTLILLVISQKIYFSRTTYKSIFHKLVLLILGAQTIISFMSLLIFSDKFYVLNLTNNSNGFEVISFLFDKVSIVMLSFISFIGLCVYKYSLNYLDKEVGHEKFLQSLQ
jgi:NADH:ubiquinone oxidoreductase subunit 5 (subunit L)/multisubunit Na+/H+ antiporter MnhA subunit